MIHPEQERVQRLLSEAISLLCRNALPFKTDIQVDGLIGITIDKCDILLISLREQIESTLLHVTETVKTSNKYKDQESPSRQNRKRHTAVDQDQNSAVKFVRDSNAQDSNAQDSNAQDSNAQDSNASISPRRKYVKCESDEDISNGCERKEINNVSERLSPETKSTSAPSVSAVKNIMPSACVQVKQEESDECLVIESDDDHDPAVNTNHDNPADNLTHHGSWLSPVGSAWQLNSSHAAFPEIQEQVSWSFDGIGNAASAGSSSENMFDSTLANDAIRPTISNECLEERRRNTRERVRRYRLRKKLLKMQESLQNYNDSRVCMTEEVMPGTSGNDASDTHDETAM